MSNEQITKVNEKFNKAVFGLGAILGDKKHLNPKGKANNETIGNIVQELINERTEETKTKVKDGLKKALDAYSTLEKELKAKREELKKLEVQKKEEFCKTLEDLYKSIENVDVIIKSYTDALEQKGVDEVQDDQVPGN